MKNTLLLISIMLLSITCYGQQTEARKIYLDEAAAANNNMRSTFLFQSFVNTGETALPSIETAFTKHFTEGYEKTSSTPWMMQSIYTPVGENQDPEVIITGTYQYSATTKENKQKYYEKGSHPQLPYFVLSTIYTAHLDVIMNYEYQDGSTLQDTISITKDKAIKLGEDPITFEGLEEDLLATAKREIRALTSYTTRDQTWFKFPKVKAKDKALKTELASISGLLKNKDYQQVGIIYKKAFEESTSPEASVALAMCYELVGNYPKALEHYKAKPDFQINSRMKKSMKLLEYAQYIGFEPEFIEF